MCLQICSCKSEGGKMLIGRFVGLLCLCINVVLLWIQGLFAFLFIISGDIKSLIDFCSFLVWIFYGFAMVALMVMRKTKKDASRHYKVRHSVSSELWAELIKWTDLKPYRSSVVLSRDLLFVFRSLSLFHCWWLLWHCSFVWCQSSQTQHQNISLPSCLLGLEWFCMCH